MPIIEVRSKTQRRSRAGLAFTREPSVVEVTEEQEAAIRADDLLLVTAEKPSAPVESIDDKKPNKR